jgi:hypothetical protein
MTQNVQKWKSIINFNFHCEFDGRSNTDDEEIAVILLLHVAKPRKCRQCFQAILQVCGLLFPQSVP